MECSTHGFSIRVPSFWNIIPLHDDDITHHHSTKFSLGWPELKCLHDNPDTDIYASIAALDMYGVGLVLVNLITGCSVNESFPPRDLSDIDQVRENVLSACPPSLVELAMQLIGDVEMRPDVEVAKVGIF
jgi:hypothetical protein